MDHKSIDRLSRMFAAGLSRRSLAGLALAALATTPRDLAAKKKKKKCKGGLTRCTVKKGKKKKTICANAQTDSANCGGCGRACANGQTCNGGSCIDGSCTPDPKGVTCENRCGNVQNNCQQMVNCGVCTCLPVTTTGELQAAIDAVDPGGTLELCAGTWSITATVTISDDMTLRGAGVGQTILDGNDAVRVLWIDDAGATVELEDLTITRGFVTTGPDSNGAGVRNDGAFSMRRVEITQCEAGGLAGGGGLFNNGPLDLYDGVQITLNHAFTGGGLYTASNSNVTMHVGSLISENTATSGGGVSLTGGTFTMGSGSRVRGNQATQLGGGVLSVNSTILLQDGSMIGGQNSGDGNNGGDFGGGLYASGGTVTLESGSKIIGNTATVGAGIRNNSTVVSQALICDNYPLLTQCSGLSSTEGWCPNPESGVCP